MIQEKAMASARNKRRRRRSRGRLGPLFKGLCALAVVVALTMGATVFFQVETVAVSGNSRYTEEDVVKASGIQTGDNLFRMNKLQIKQQILQQLPYMEDVVIRRGLPSTILITVSEWDAVARIEASTGASAAPAVPAEEAPEPSADASADAKGDSSAQEDGAPKPAAQEPWLISVGGKLLEPAPPGNKAISVTGLTALMPSAGTGLAVPLEEQPRLDALLALLAALEERGMLDQVSAVALEDTRVNMRLLDRFDVEMPLNGDFRYHLSVLEQVVPKLNDQVGESCTGTLDLTRENYPAVFTPN